ncbi:NADP-dependent oxidoreductase [Enterococcus canis]|nr:NADP-dependent oxidoreductase [Enterococcus canis]
MKAFAIKEYGAPDVFETIEIAGAPLKDKQVRVAVKAFAINPYDTALRRGEMDGTRPIEFPYVMGSDASGVVIEVGSAVTDFKVGDEVIVHAPKGAYGEEVVVFQSKVVLKPAEVSFAEGAGLPTIGITAYNLLHHLLPVEAGTLVVQGASGGVGSSLVQLAQNDFRVLAIASSRNKDYVESLGNVEFLAYDQTEPAKVWADQGDVVIDATKGSRGIENGLAILKAGGVYVALNDLPSAAQQAAKPATYLHMGPSKEYKDREAFDYLLAQMTAGRFQVKIDRVLPFTTESVIEAHRLLEGHPPAGKLIIAREA